jgi:tRNA threonylcarbamoyladenosine biosynthesis protein TsaB
VRLAASVAQGLAFGAQLPVVPVSDLAALAERVLSENAGTRRVIVCTDARLGEVYWGCFERGESGLAAAATPERVSRPEAVHLPDGWNGPAEAWLAAGSGFSAYPQLKVAVGAVPDGIREGLFPRAREVARLAAPEVSGGRALPAEEAIPVYLRDDVTQASRPRSSN